MFDPSDVPPVAGDETVARFATQSGQFRADRTVKQDLFIPNARGETSLMRHYSATEQEIWNVGSAVAASVSRTLYGRSDIQVAECAALKLAVMASPYQNNPNHADIKNWPETKEDRKAIAVKLAAVASKLIPPPWMS